MPSEYDVLLAPEPKQTSGSEYDVLLDQPDKIDAEHPYGQVPKSDQPQIRAPTSADLPLETLGAAGRLVDRLFSPGEKVQHSIVSPEVAELGTRLAAAPTRLATSLLEKFTGKPYTQAEQGVEQAISGAVSGFSLENLAALPAFLVPGVAETYAAGLVAKLPEQYGHLKEAIERHGLLSSETGQAFTEAGIQDVIGFLGLKGARAGRANFKAGLTERLGLSADRSSLSSSPETPATDAAVSTLNKEVIPNAAEPERPPGALSTERGQPALSQTEIETQKGDTRQAPPQESDQAIISPSTAVSAAPVSGQESPPAAARLIPGETQGDLISSTQTEPFALSGEKATDFQARAAETASAARTTEEVRLKSEHEQGLLSDFAEHQAQGGSELLDAIESGGGLPALSSVRSGQLSGELQNIREEFATAGGAKRTGSDYNKVFKSDAPDIDTLTQHLKAKGFDVETPAQTLELVQNRLRTGQPIFGSEAKGQAVAAAGTPYEALGISAQQPTLATKVIKSLQTAADAIRSFTSNRPPSVIEPPTLNISTGGAKPPPPNSIFAPDTLPGGDPVPIYATRVTNVFKLWWEKFWPRDLAVTKVAPDSPVITAHQQILKSQMDYMQKFAAEPWWKALRSRSNEELIDIEDRAVKEYHGHIENGVDPKQAYQAAVSKTPDWFQDIVRHRESRVPIEIAAANDLGVEPPRYTGDPYIARLTNEDGKDVVDLHPSIGNLGRQIRTTIGSFDNSRVHLTIKDGIAKGVQYEPVSRSVWLRELTSIRLEATANLLRSLKENGVLFDSKEGAYAASPKSKISLVRGLGGNDYWARSPEEAIFLEQNITTTPRSPLGRIQQLANTYVRNPSLINPLPHVTKNMAFKYALARVGNFTFKADVAEFARSTPTELKTRFDKVMPFVETGERLPQLTAKEVGTWAEKTLTGGMKINNPSSQFIFAKADPAMRYSLWKSYVKKGMGDQEAANHVWLDLIRYDANSGGMNFWKSIPFNFFVPWRTGTYVTLAKQFRAHPIRTLLFIGAVEYMREVRYRKSGRWTHLPVDYIDAPLAEAIQNPKGAPGAAATTLLFGPGGGQAPSTIKDVIDLLHSDPQNKSRVMNMFWGLSQLYNIPKEWDGYRRDGNTDHLVNIVTSAAIAEHSAIKYEPRRLMKWLPEWMPGLEKSELVRQAEELRGKVEEKRQKSELTYQSRHGVSASFERTPQEQQLEELSRAAGIRTDATKPFSLRKNRGRKKEAALSGGE